MNKILQYKILLLGVIGASCLMLFLLPPVQCLCMNVLSIAAHKTFVLDDVWRGRFIEHSLRFALLILLSSCVLQFFTLDKLKNTAEDTAQGKRYLCFFAVCAFLIAGVCSTCSPLYPLNPWDDSNAFFTAGKAIVHGKVMYRDIYEQKGPLIYFLHSAAYLASHTTFLGVYIIEVIAAASFMFYVHKTMCLFTTPQTAVVLVPFFAVFVYTSSAFSFGDSAEEFCLPVIMYAFYTSLLHIKSNSDFTAKELLITGILAGCVLWIKFTLLGFFIGWAVVPIVQYTRRCNVRGIFKAIGLVMCGVAIATVPYIVYFGANHALGDWFGVYIHDNIFTYSKGHIGQLALPLAIAKGIAWAYWRDPYMLLMTIISVIVLRHERAVLCYTLFMCIAGGIFVYCGGRTHIYYGFGFWAFTPFAMLPLCALMQRVAAHRKVALAAALLLPPLLAFCLTPNRSIMRIKQDDMPQFKFNKIIMQRKDPTLLCYRMVDGSFYTVSGIVPNTKYFVQINMPLKDMTDTQDQIVNAGLVDFVVTNKEISASRYTLADTASITIRSRRTVFYLYQLRVRPIQDKTQ